MGKGVSFAHFFQRPKLELLGGFIRPIGNLHIDLGIQQPILIAAVAAATFSAARPLERSLIHHQLIQILDIL
jgi:hypothetical protein